MPEFTNNKAGTHDLALISNTLDALKGLGTSQTNINCEDGSSYENGNKIMKSVDNVLVPQYNKSLRGGRGDREAESQWINATGKKFRKEKENCIMRRKVSCND